MVGQTKDEWRSELRANGLMDDFKQRRTELEGEGVSKKDSWSRAAAEFGYGNGNIPAPSTTTVKRVAKEPGPKKDQFRGKTASLRAEFQWVYENVALEDVRPEDAPSSGAWGLLEFARSDPRTFYSRWLEMASKSEDRNLVMEGFKEDARRTTAEIANMLESIRSAVVQQDPQGSSAEPELPAGDTVEVGF